MLRSVCDRVVVAVPPGMSYPDSVEGGPVRSDSVRRALAAAPEATIVVVHDAARPFVTADLVQKCIEELRTHDAAIAAAPVTDTVKEADASRRVTRTLDRARLWAIQTPQVFRADVLRRALDVPLDALAAATDDASLVEAAGGSVVVVEAPPENVKITRAIDLRARRSQACLLVAFRLDAHRLPRAPAPGRAREHRRGGVHRRERRALPGGGRRARGGGARRLGARVPLPSRRSTCGSTRSGASTRTTTSTPTASSCAPRRRSRSASRPTSCRAPRTGWRRCSRRATGTT